MSIYTVTIEHLMQLDKPKLEYALHVFEQELNGMLDLLAGTPEARHDEKVLLDLEHALTLRKVFRHRLQELADEASGASEVLAGAPLQLAA